MRSMPACSPILPPFRVLGAPLPAALLQALEVAERAQELLGLLLRHRLLHAGSGRRLRGARLRLAARGGRRRRGVLRAAVRLALLGLRLLSVRLRGVGIGIAWLRGLVAFALQPLVIPARIGVV